MLKGRRREQNGRVKTELRQTHMILQGQLLPLIRSLGKRQRVSVTSSCQAHSSPHKDGQLPLQQNSYLQGLTSSCPLHGAGGLS